MRGQEEHCDEMEEMVSHKAMTRVWQVIFFGSIIVQYVSDKRGLPTAGNSLLIQCGFFTGSIYKYIKTKEKSYLWFSLLFGAMVVWDLVRFIQGY